MLRAHPLAGPPRRQDTECQVLATVSSRNGAKCERSHTVVRRFGGSSPAVAKAWDCIIPAGTVDGRADAVLIRSKGTSMTGRLRRGSAAATLTAASRTLIMRARLRSGLATT